MRSVRDIVDAAEWRDSLRGKMIEPGVWRNWCCQCGAPLNITDKRLAGLKEMTCDGCSSLSGNAIPTTAFSPDRKLSK